jgi:hypothetical protein
MAVFEEVFCDELIGVLDDHPPYKTTCHFLWSSQKTRFGHHSPYFAHTVFFLKVQQMYYNKNRNEPEEWAWTKHKSGAPSAQWRCLCLGRFGFVCF